MQVADRLYERLGPEERFRAALEAFSRKDLGEIDRLNDTCPTETVRIQSLAYFGRLRGFHELAMMQGIALRDLMVEIWIYVYRLSRSGAFQAANAQTESEAIDGEDELACELTDSNDESWNALYTSVSRLKAFRAAWVQFCEPLGVDPSGTLFAYYSESAEIADLCDMIEVDEACQAEVLEGLQKSWAVRESRSQAHK